MFTSKAQNRSSLKMFILRFKLGYTTTLSLEEVWLEKSINPYQKGTDFSEQTPLVVFVQYFSFVVIFIFFK